MDVERTKYVSSLYGIAVLGAVIGSILGMVLGAITGLIVEELIFTDLPRWLPNIIEDTRETFVVGLFSIVGWTAGFVTGGVAGVLSHK